VISLPGIALAAVVLALMFRPAFHFIPWAVLASIPAIVLAFVLRFLLEWTLALAAFWTTRVSAINQMYFVALLFLSGQVAPIALLPAWVRAAADILPFRWMIGFPVELLLGRLTPAQALTGLGVQVIWIALGLALVRLVWRAGVRAYSAVGA
jgi:ABC-2 type transport system permease protein